MRACVIGGGASGLAAIKECHEAGLEVIAYERTSDIGGRWNYRPQMKEGGNVMKSTISYSSKEMMAYSDFPPSADYPNFMHHSLIQKYMRDYAEKFNLLEHIRFNTAVEKLERVDGKWEVITSKGQKDYFDFALICTGRHSIPQQPKLKGIENFQGRVLHSRNYHEPNGFEDKNVFIVGLGNSALDIAVELASVAKTVTISTRRGSWIASRVWSGGIPHDVALNNRFYKGLFSILPWTILNEYMERHFEFRIGHHRYGLRPHHRFFQQPYTICDPLPNLLSSGAVVITEDIDHVDTSGVIVEGDNRYPADVIIFATGYVIQFPYLYPQSVIPIQENEMDLYKFVFPPNYPSLAAIGFAQTIGGAIAPVAEMQSRWVAAVFSGRLKLPHKYEMLNNIKATRELHHKRFYKSPRNALKVDYMAYMDDLATFVGCKPKIWKYALCEPRLALRLLVGTNAPYVYRLQGKGHWDDAKNALDDLPERVKKPLKNRECDIQEYKQEGSIFHCSRYVIFKTLLLIGCSLLMTALWTYISAPSEMRIPYAAYVFVFLNLCTASMLWFDKQYNYIYLF